MIKMLVKVQLMGAINSVLGGSKNKKQSSIIKLILIGLLAIYIIATLLFTFGMMFYQLAQGLVAMNLGGTYFSYIGIMSFALSAMFSVFMAQSMLYEARDNELLLSMPIKPKAILGSRLLALAIIEYITNFIIMIPACVVYVNVANPSPVFYIMAIFAMLLLPLLGLTFSAFFGYLISFVTSRIRRKSLFVTVFSILLFAAYMWGYMSLMGNLNGAILNGTAISESIKTFLPPFYYFGAMIADFDVVALVIFAIFSIVPILIVYYLLSQNFIKIVTTKPQLKKIVYKEEKAATNSAFIALLKKEAIKFFSTPTYILNTGIAYLMIIGFGIFIAIQGPNFIQMIFAGMPAAKEIAVPIVVAILSFSSMMGYTTAPSISLEGKNIWIIKSSPIRTNDVLNAKLAFSIILGCMSLLIADALIIFTLKPDIIGAVIIVLVPIAVQLFVALQGLISNLIYPKLDFTSEAMVVKQSASVMVSMLVSMALMIGILMLYLLLFIDICSFNLFAFGIIVCIMALNIVAYRFIMTRGIKMFERL